MTIVHVTDASGKIVEPVWLKRAESVHRQLRTALPADYEGKMKRVFAGGARMCISADRDAVRGVPGFRINEKTFGGLHPYVADPATDPRHRPRGVGRAPIEHL